MTKHRVAFSLLISMFAVPPFLNSLSNPRLGALHGSDFMQLIAVGLCLGFAFGVLFGGLKFSGK